MTAEWQSNSQGRAGRVVALDSQAQAAAGPLCRKVLFEEARGEIGRGRITAPGDAPVEAKARNGKKPEGHRRVRGPAGAT
jgi:hypothetical protein